MIIPAAPVLPREQYELLRQANLAHLHDCPRTAAAFLLIHDLRFGRPSSSRSPACTESLPRAVVLTGSGAERAPLRPAA